MLFVAGDDLWFKINHSTKVDQCDAAKLLITSK